MSTVSLKIRGMDCAEEVNALRAELGRLRGVEDLRFDLLQAKMTVTFEPSAVDASQLITAVRRTGMSAEVFQDAPADESPRRFGARTLTTTASAVFIIAAFIVHGVIAGWLHALTGAGGMPWISKALYVTAAVAGGWFVLPRALAAARRLRPDMNLLMTLAVAGALALGQYFEAATVAFLFAVSLALEGWSVGRARRAIASLVNMTPTRARVFCASHGHEEMIDVEKVAQGTTVIVKPGEKFPLDGTLTRGATTVDQSPITGESVPVDKRVGDDVYAGTINHDGAVEFKTTRAAEDTTFSRIIQMVRDSQSRRAPSEQWVDKFARYYTPAVVALAVLVAVVLPVATGGHWAKWVYEALVLLVIACPCALVISTPVSIVSALASAARSGVLIKGGLYIETPGRLTAVAMDKTGTLTQGRPVVQQVIPLGGHDQARVLATAAAIEMRSEHPLAHAVVEAAKQRSIPLVPADDVRVIKGKGVTANIDGQAVWIGSHRMLEEHGRESPEVHKRIEELTGGGVTVVALGRGDRVFGLITVADQIRENAKDAIAALKALGVKHLVMLTGDNRATAEAVARATGMTEVHAELLPEDKVSQIEQLVRRYDRVAMIGDGINDAPAMARATLGVAMGSMGSDAAIETADIALMSDDLSRLPMLVRHSRRTLRIIRQNIFLAIGVKLVFVLLTFAGHASLWAAIAADTGVALLVVFNALRLLPTLTPEPRP